MKSNQTLQLLGSAGGAYRLDELRIYGSALNGGQVAALSVLAPSNAAPVLATIPNCTLIAGQVLIFTNSASDPDSPPQTLTFNLLSGPGGATVNLTNGVFSWRPSIAQSPTTNMIWVTVADSGTPSLNDTQSFMVTVLQPMNPTLGATRPAISNGMFNLRVNGNSGPDYILYGASSLTPPVNWQPLKTNLSATPPFTFSDPATNVAAKFYRVQLAP